MVEIAEKMTLLGNCTLMPNELTRPSKDDYTKEEVFIIDKMHKEKIKLSDSVLVEDVDHYIGKSTLAEMEYAKSLNKEILYYMDLMENMFIV